MRNGVVGGIETSNRAMIASGMRRHGGCQEPLADEAVRSEAIDTTKDEHCSMSALETERTKQSALELDRT
jgi:hypothetical protein